MPFPYLFIVEFLYNDGHKGIFRQGICLTTLYRSLSSALGIFSASFADISEGFIVMLDLVSRSLLMEFSQTSISV